MTVLSGIATFGGWLLLSAFDPITILSSSRLARATAAFLLVLFIGGVLLVRFHGFVGRAVDATVDRPLRSTAYGLATQAVVVFAAVLLTAKLSQFRFGGGTPAGIGILAGLGVALVVAAVGFTVVGAGIFELGGEPSPWGGLVLGAAIAGALAVADPSIAWLLWLGVAAVGIGGPVRSFVHASAIDDV